MTFEDFLSEPLEVQNELKNLMIQAAQNKSRDFLTLLTRYTLMDTGELRDSAYIEPTAAGFDVVYEADYAPHAYYIDEINEKLGKKSPVTPTTPGTTPKWLTALLSDNNAMSGWYKSVYEELMNLI